MKNLLLSMKIQEPMIISEEFIHTKSLRSIASVCKSQGLGRWRILKNKDKVVILRLS